MQHDPFYTIFGLVLTIISGSAAIGGCLAHAKRRSPIEGLLLGLFLGPIGILIELRTSFNHRPLVDEASSNSFRSVTNYQATGREFQSRSARDEKRQQDRDKNPPIGG